MGQMAARCLVGRQGDAEAVSDGAERLLTLQPRHNQLPSPLPAPAPAATEAEVKKRGSLVTLDVHKSSVPRGKKEEQKNTANKQTTAAAANVLLLLLLFLSSLLLQLLVPFGHILSDICTACCRLQTYIRRREAQVPTAGWLIMPPLTLLVSQCCGVP